MNMTTNEMNAVIARFMGWEQIKDTETMVVSSGQRLNISEFHYHSNWNQLMPVVDKIEALGVVVDILADRCYIEGIKFKYDLKTHLDSKKASTHSAVYQFCQWYLDNNKTEQQ